MSEEWKALGDADRQVYQAHSDREKEKYERDMRVFKDKLAKQEAAAAGEGADHKAHGGAGHHDKVVGQKRKGGAQANAAAAAAPNAKGGAKGAKKEGAQKQTKPAGTKGKKAAEKHTAPAHAKNEE